MFRDLSAKSYPMFRDFLLLRKSHPFERHAPVYLIRRVPPPPPPGKSLAAEVPGPLKSLEALAR